MKKLPWIALGMALMAVPTALAATLVFSDVKETDWYYEAVHNLKGKKIIEGYEDGTYGPEKDINRAEMAVMMDRLVKKVENGCVFMADDYDYGPETNRFFLDGELVYNVGEGAEIAKCEKGDITIEIAD